MANVRQLTGEVHETAALAYGASGADSRLARWIIRQITDADNPDGPVIFFKVHRSDQARRVLAELDSIRVEEPGKIMRKPEEDRQAYLANLVTDIFLAADDDTHSPGAAPEYIVVCHREREPMRRCSTHTFAPSEAPAGLGGHNAVDSMTLANIHTQDRRHIERLMQQNALLMQVVAQTMANDLAAKQARLDMLERRDQERQALLEAADSKRHEREIEAMKVAQDLRVQDKQQERWDHLFGWIMKTGGPMLTEWIGEAKRDPKAKPDDKLVALGNIISNLPDDAKLEFQALLMGLPQEQRLGWMKVYGDIDDAKKKADAEAKKTGGAKIRLVSKLIDDLPQENRKQFDAILARLPDDQRASWEAIFADAKE